MDILVGALIFISIDRVCRIISRHMVNKYKGDHDALKRAMLTIELMTLFTALFIAFHFIG